MTRAPGIGLAACATVALLAATPVLARMAPSLSPLVLALLLGAVVGSVLGALARRAPDAPRARGVGPVARFLAAIGPGTAWTARHLLRAGVVLLGLQLSVGDVLGLGWRGLLIVSVTVATTFTTTLAIGRRLRVAPDTTLLVATGFSICGAAAISAMTGVLDRTPRRLGTADDTRVDDGDSTGTAVATALALVALFGTAAVVVLPWLADLLGLTATQAGLWIGASVQEVAQVVAAAGTLAGSIALATATVSKLARVVLLAPIVATVGAVRSRRAALTAPLAPDDAGARTRRPAPIPGFVVGFLVAVAVRSTGLLPASILDGASHVATALFVAAMFALGLGVDVPRLVRAGRRPLLLGACSAVVVTSTALAMVLLLA